MCRFKVEVNVLKKNFIGLATDWIVYYGALTYLELSQACSQYFIDDY